VQPGSFTHQTELFGPILGVMKARDLDEAIHFANQTGYGLTAGLESLDDREQDLWQQSTRAGNLYVNRGTTGAIVLRQPFGGMGKSAFGPGIKVGGPNYVAQLMTFRETASPEGVDVDDPLVADLLTRLRAQADADTPYQPEEVDRIVAAARSYTRWFRDEFGQTHDHFRLVGQDNSRFVEETDEELVKRISGRQVDRLRYTSPVRVPRIVREVAPEVQLDIADWPVLY